MNDKQLKMAVNHAVRDLRNARARAALLHQGMGLDAKRSSAWCEYGFKEDLTFHDLYKLYRRSGIAYGAVNKVVSPCWSTQPEIIEGEEEDETRDVTAWEKSLKTVFNKRFWNAFAEADLRRLVGRYSGILLYIRDGRQWDKPVLKGRGLEKVSPVWAGAIKVAEYDDDPKSKSYGQPKMWEYSERSPNGAGRKVNIHPDRVFILGDYSDDAIGFLEPGYNAFTSIEKVEGGSGESFLKNSARQLGINFEKEVDLSGLANLYGVSLNELQEKFNEVAKEINAGNDTILITQGATATPLVSEVPDPSSTYNINLQTIATSVDIPVKILIGMQTGERASTEDQDYMNARCQSRRESELSIEIDDFCDKLIELKVINPIPEKSVIWDNLTERSPSEKLDTAEKMARINSILLAQGQPAFSVKEVRITAGYDAKPDEYDDDEPPLGEDDEEE